jgi:HAD superfamily hydrolase (TIGR01509 family)
MPLIIFDCDGVLLETESLANRCEVDALGKLGYTISLEEYIDLSLGRHNIQVEELLKEKFNIDLPPHFWSDVKLEQQDLFDKHLIPVAGVIETLELITTQKCIASSSSMERLNHTLGITKLLPYFENRIFSTEFVSRGKPFPDIYLYAAEKMKMVPKECVVIEDSLAGIEGALAAKMTVFAFGGGQHITAKIKHKLQKSGAHQYFERMQNFQDILKNIK